MLNRGQQRERESWEMEVGEQRWRISVRARSRNFRFRLKATNVEPTWNLVRFSLFLRLHQFLLRLRSQPKSPPPPIHHTPGGARSRSQKKTTDKNKSKLPRFFHKLRTPPPPTTSTPDPREPILTPPNTNKERLGVGGLAVGSIGVLGEWVTAKEQRRLVVYMGSSILVLLSLFLLLNKLLLPLRKASGARWLVFLAFLALVLVLVLVLPLYLEFPTFPFYR